MYTTKEHNPGSGFIPTSAENPSPSREGEGRIEQTDPEVSPKRKRRYYTTKYKLRILDQVDRFTEQGQLGAFLRREGLYYSTISLGAILLIGITGSGDEKTAAEFTAFLGHTTSMSYCSDRLYF